MKSIRYKITTSAPILLSGGSGDLNSVVTKESIPGSAVLGMFANKLMNKILSSQTKLNEDDFYSWFLEGKLRFTNAYILSNTSDGEKLNYPLPFSIQQVKNTEEKIHNLLYEKVIEQTRPLGGFGNIVNGKVITQVIDKSLNFHHERDESTGSTKQGIFYNYESMDAFQTFTGSVVGDESDLIKFLNEFDKVNQVYFGRSKNAQYGGKATLEFAGISKSDFYSEIDIMNDQSKMVITEGSISLTFISDVILYDENGVSSGSYANLEKYLSEAIENEKITVGPSFLKKGYVDNYVSIWKLKKPSEVCFLAGSTMLLTNLDDDFKDKLLSLQIEGIGERKGEGFGRIVFGWHINEKIVRNSCIPAAIEKPLGSNPPEITLGIVGNILKGHIRNSTKVKALEKVTELKRGIITSSQISKLESFIKEVSKLNEPQKEFIKMLASLRETSKDKLESCKFSDESLLQFLQHAEINADVLFPRESDGERNINLALYEKITTDLNAIEIFEEEFMNELFVLYFLTFFSALRKRFNKKGGN
ncbi:MAG: hypothetical protein KKA84_06745 [Bacteroidetes bacterium]|nr:hypothetical protein [Bacteroidota bacterium]